MTSFIPSPTVGGFHLGPLLIHGYALSILTGILVAIWLTDRRLQRHGVAAGAALDISAFAVPAGIIGGRIYHVITTPEPYFGANGNPWQALRIWEGGLGIWGAIALGAAGAWWGCRRFGVPFLVFADAAAPGVAIAQALGRLGNWFNNELYGAPTTVPWKLKIYQWDPSAARAVTGSDGKPVVLGYFQPTFLYELIFLLVLAAVLLRLDASGSLRRGQLFAAYVIGYPIGRVVVEFLRTDPAHHVLGVRLNVWTSLAVFVLGVALFRLWRGNPPGNPRDVSNVGTSSLES